MALSGRAPETHVVSNLQGRARQSLRAVLVSFVAWLRVHGARAGHGITTSLTLFENHLVRYDSVKWLITNFVWFTEAHEINAFMDFGEPNEILTLTNGDARILRKSVNDVVITFSDALPQRSTLNPQPVLSLQPPPLLLRSRPTKAPTDVASNSVESKSRMKKKAAQPSSTKKEESKPSHFDESSVPTTLYKYRSLRSVKFITDIFEKRRLFLPYVDALNDPDEGAVKSIERPNWNECYNLLGAVLQQINVGKTLQKTRVLCLSKDPANELMWSHYADGHRGIVLGFRAKGFRPFSDARPVSYVADLRSHEHVIPPDSDSHQQASLFHKKKSWSYEKEWRLVYPDNVKYLTMGDQVFQNVTFGYRTSTKDKKMITNCISNAGLQIEYFEISQEGYKLKRLPLSVI